MKGALAAMSVGFLFWGLLFFVEGVGYARRTVQELTTKERQRLFSIFHEKMTGSICFVIATSISAAGLIFVSQGIAGNERNELLSLLLFIFSISTLTFNVMVIHKKETANDLETESVAPFILLSISYLFLTACVFSVAYFLARQ